MKRFKYVKKFSVLASLEWSGVVCAILYSLILALNLGVEFYCFILLFISASLIGVWAYLCSHYGVLLLQGFYAVAALLGMYRWY